MAPRHLAVVDGHRLLAQDVLDDQDRLGEADVGQRRRVDDVADGVDAGLAGSAVLVDLDEATIGDLDGRVPQTELVGERTAPDATRSPRRPRGCRPRRHRPEVHDGAARIGGRVAEHLDTGADVDVLLLEAAHDDVGDVGVEAGQDLRQTFEDGDLRSRGRRTCEANSQPIAPPPMTTTRAGT